VAEPYHVPQPIGLVAPTPDPSPDEASADASEPLVPTGQVEIAETLEELAREGARRMLERALHSEVDAYLGRRRYDRVEDDFSGYRNGYAREREISIGTWAVWNAPSRRECELRRDELAQWLHTRGQDPAAETLFRDWDDLTTFYDFPAEHWIHLRTSNPVESVFAGVRLRTNVSKRIRRRDSALYPVFRITQRLELGWRPLNGGLTLMTLLLRGARFVDGMDVPADVDRPDDPGEEVSAA
jgi:transposase-like protein